VSPGSGRCFEPLRLVHVRTRREIYRLCRAHFYDPSLGRAASDSRRRGGRVAAPVGRRHVGSLPRCAGYRQGHQPTSASKRARRPRPLPAGGVGLLVCGLSRCEALRMGLHAAQRAPAQESRNKVAQLARRLGCAASCAWCSSHEFAPVAAACVCAYTRCLWPFSPAAAAAVPGK